MSKYDHPTPSIFDENQFHNRNSQIVKNQKMLIAGLRLPYSQVLKLKTEILYMRKANGKFNVIHGLQKEIA